MMLAFVLVFVSSVLVHSNAVTSLKPHFIDMELLDLSSTFEMEHAWSKQITDVHHLLQTQVINSVKFHGHY